MGASKIARGDGQISDMRYRGPETGLDDDIFQAQPAVLPDWQARGEPPPGYQQPPQGQQQQQAPTQYYQQMRESMSGMDKALKELEGMQMPGGQYQQPSYGYNPGGGKRGKGMSLF